MNPEVFTFNEALRIERRCLPNGLTLLTLPDPHAEIISYQSWLRVGSADDPPGQAGLAHLLEHLMFKGTARFAEGALDQHVSAMGGAVNAATGLDWTFYYQDVPHAALLPLVEMEADRLTALSLHPTQVEAERAVVLQERMERVDEHPDGLLGELLWGTAFEGQPYGAPTVGWRASIEAIDALTLRRFYQARYAPNHLVLILSGRVSPAQIEAVIGHYEGLAPSPPPPPTPPSPGHWAEGPRRRARRLAIPVERLLWGLPGLPINHPLHPALEILNEALFEGDAAPVTRRLVEELEIAMGVYAAPPSFREGGLYEISVDLRAGLPAERAEEALLAALATLRREGLGEGALRRAKKTLLVRSYRGLQAHQQRAQSLGFWEIMGGFERLFERAEAYTRVGLDEVMAAFDALDLDARVTVIGRPEGHA